MASLLEQREQYLKEKEALAERRKIEKYDKAVKNATEFFNNEELDKLIYDYLIKHGIVDVSLGMCLCGENGCISGRKLFDILDEKGVFDKYKKEEIRIEPRWDCFRFKLGRNSHGDIYLIFKKDNEGFDAEYK